MGGIIPLSDATRQPRRYPIATAAIIVLNVLVLIAEIVGGDAFVLRWSMVPAEIVAGHRWSTLITALFMHAGWMHIIGNMIFLWAFGPQVEDTMGRLRYVTFYLLSGFAAWAAQIAAMPGSTVPNLGASGAIAGVMGAFLVTYPRDRIRSVLLIGWFVQIALIPAALLIGLWFVIQFFSEFGAVTDVHGGGVAYTAHVGGFVFGVITARLFERVGRTAKWGG